MQLHKQTEQRRSLRAVAPVAALMLICSLVVCIIGGNAQASAASHKQTATVQVASNVEVNAPAVQAAAHVAPAAYAGTTTIVDCRSTAGGLNSSVTRRWTDGSAWVTIIYVAYKRGVLVSSWSGMVKRADAISTSNSLCAVALSGGTLGG